jgi:hypothetical protein
MKNVVCFPQPKRLPNLTATETADDIAFGGELKRMADRAWLHAFYHEAIKVTGSFLIFLMIIGLVALFARAL